MGKKENGFIVLMAIAFNILVGWMWYYTLYPKEVISHIDAVVCGVLLTLITTIALGVSAWAYMDAIAED